jgi:23S rRNA (uracil1939-C5)-methyltransferase
MSSVETKHEPLEVKIERLLPGGVGLAHANDMTLFVALAAPGDTLNVTIDRTQGKVAFASIVQVVEPSPVRVEPPCPYFGRCGGCNFQQLTYEAQLDAKVQIIRDCLHRIAKIDNVPNVVIHRSPKEWRYRSRANWQYDRTTKDLGYFERGSNVVCDVEYCAVLEPVLEQTLERVRHEVRAGSPLPPVKGFEVVAGDKEVSLFPRFAGLETKDISRIIGQERYFFSAEAFFQVNHDLLEQLITEAVPNRQGTELYGTAIDLYCGVGLFTVPLARQFERVIGIEANARSTQFARRNVEFANHRALAKVDVVTERVGDWLHLNARSVGPVDFLLLDPPRTGCENSVIAGILSMRPSQISYVSCDPATLARDLKKLTAAGYSLDSISAYDMFPQTHHVETIARLSASSAAG